MQEVMFGEEHSKGLIAASLGAMGWRSTDVRDRCVALEAGAAGAEAGVSLFALADHQGDHFLLNAAAQQGQAEAAELVLRMALERDRVVTTGMVVDGTEDGAFVLAAKPGSSQFRRSARIDAWRPPADGSVLRTSLQPADGPIEGLLFEVHSHMRDVDGLHAPEAVDELCKLIFLKVHDERARGDGEPIRLQRRAHGSLEAYAAAARRMYQQALAGEDVWSPLILSDQALVRCLDQLEPWSLLNGATDVKGRAFQNVLRPAARAGMGQYFTPDGVARFMVDVVGPKAGERVLDPFAGSAHFLALAAPYTQDVRGIEKSERMMRVAWTDLVLHDLDALNLLCGDALGEVHRQPGFELGSFDVVLTNPPFGSVLRADAIAQYGHFDTAQGRGSTPIEVLGLERAIQFLVPGGRLAIVLPDGLLGNRRTESVRAWAAHQIALRALVSLPVEVFSPFGANVKTSVVFARRLAAGETVDPQTPLFLGRVDSVGHDASGRPTGEDELPEVARRLKAFLDKEGW